MTNFVPRAIKRNAGSIGVAGASLLIVVLSSCAGEGSRLIDASLQMGVLEEPKPSRYEDLRPNPVIEGQIPPIDYSRARLK